jgi:hypothetical protein
MLYEELGLDSRPLAGILKSDDRGGGRTVFE